MSIAILGVPAVILIPATIIVLVAGRREADEDRHRAEARYLGALCLLSIFVALAGVYAAVSELAQFVIPANHRFGGASPLGIGNGGGFETGNNVIWRGFVQALLVLLVAGAIFLFHWRRRRELRANPGFPGSAATRVDVAHIYAACFVAAVVILLALSVGLYALFRVAAPGVATFQGGSSVRERGLAQALSLLALGLGAFGVFRLHWSQRPDVERVRVDAPPPAPVATPN